MNSYLNRLIKYVRFLIPENLKKKIRKFRRRILVWRRSTGSGFKKLSLDEMRDILTNELNLNNGDTVIVHSSFGNLFAEFSPIELIGLLKDIVTNDGNILMPYYPSGHAYHWIQKNEPFDVGLTPSCMGILTQEFLHSGEVKLSPHPVKAMAVWGKDSEFLIAEHHKSVFPYDEFSPYYRTTILKNSKTIGLGIEINSFIHCCEDLFLLDKFEIYADKIFKGNVNYYDRSIEVNTYLHDPEKIVGLVSGCTFLKRTNFQGYINTTVNNTIFFSTENQLVLNHTKSLFSEGITRRTISEI
jgi:aminoglycoside 3-N-acetyltransferase